MAQYYQDMVSCQFTRSKSYREYLEEAEGCSVPLATSNITGNEAGAARGMGGN